MRHKQKPRILLCWWYDRNDLVAPFLKLQDAFEFTVLFYRFREQEAPDLDLPFPRIYWTDFASPYQILKQVCPDKVIFMGIENMLTISLNIAARTLGVPTFYLAHGITYALKDAIGSADPQQQTIARYNVHNPVYHRRKTHSLLFFLRCLRPSNLNVLPFLLRFIQISRQQANIQLRLAACVSPHRQAGTYLLFAPAYARFFQERDGVPENCFRYLGPYPMDALFTELKTSASTNLHTPYWLYIDQPLASLPWERRSALFSKIAVQANRNGRELLVKLHPMDYGQESVPEGVRFVRGGVNLGSLIGGADLCIGYYSALLLPTISFKKVLVIDPGGFEIIADWHQTGAIYYTTVDAVVQEKLDWAFLQTPLNKKEFIRQYVFEADGNGAQRLKEVLLSS